MPRQKGKLPGVGPAAANGPDTWLQDNEDGGPDVSRVHHRDDVIRSWSAEGAAEALRDRFVTGES